VRVFAVSDIHADYAENFAWVQALSQDEYLNDILILAGDVSDSMDILQRVFDTLQQRFSELLFVPGNHELWVQGSEYDCSLEKFDAIMTLCRTRQVRVDVCRVAGISFVPLLSWYDFSFGEPDRHLRRAWRDFRACRWPAHLDSSAAVSAYFLNKNLPALEASLSLADGAECNTLISYSHFLPRIDVMPAQIPEQRRRVYPVLGSEALGKQVKQLMPDIHVYGHSHVNQSVELGGIRYINNAFAYPSEERIARKQLHCIFESNTQTAGRDLAAETADSAPPTTDN